MWKIRKEWAKFSHRHYVCSNDDFEIQRDKGSVLINFYYFSTFYYKRYHNNQ